MKRVLLLTKRNFGEAIWLAKYMNKEMIGVECDMEVRDINTSGTDLGDYDLVWMYFYPYIVKGKTLRKNPNWINTHISLLPFGAGSAPNFFNIVNNEPSGVTIHFVDSKVDSGDIISQIEVEQRPDDTGESLYKRLVESSRDLNETFVDKHLMRWLICDEQPNSKPQEASRANRMSEFNRIKHLNNVFNDDEMIVINKAIRIMRASTFKGYDGATYFDDDGNLMQVSVSTKIERASREVLL